MMNAQLFAQQPAPSPEAGAQELPSEFIDWQLRERAMLFESLESGEFPRSFAAHLPSVSTMGSGAFPIHCCNKGVGMTPKDELIPELVREIKDTLKWCESRSWKESQARRIEVARLLYDHREKVDERRFGLIEIFRGQTFANLANNPCASLLFTDVAPNWLSYQVNVVAEVVEADDPRFQLILGMRLLFESDRFHIQQLEYPLGYLFWVHEVIEKTPLMGRSGRRHTAKKNGTSPQ
jgi:hypothetical protein